ncbi:unnamed protein product, partial [Meganyctiphanes norvegica]
VSQSKQLPLLCKVSNSHKNINQNITLYDNLIKNNLKNYINPLSTIVMPPSQQSSQIFNTNVIGIESRDESKKGINQLGVSSFRLHSGENSSNITEISSSKELFSHHDRSIQRVSFQLPPRHMNIPPDSSSDNGSGNENMGHDGEDESLENLHNIQCRNPSCKQRVTIEEARQSFKTCHNCFAYYCTRSCRRQHWDKHRLICKRLRALSVAKQVANKVREDLSLLEKMSIVAMQGMRSKGRGLLKIFFHDISGAESFIENGNIPGAHYIAHRDVLPNEASEDVYKQMMEACQQYNPDAKFVLCVSICIMNEIPTDSSPKWEREVISYCIKLRLFSSNFQNKMSDKKIVPHGLDEPEA